jgi:hypothetical protein
MDAVSLARGRSGENDAPQVKRIHLMCENRGRAEYGKPSTTKSSFADEACRDLSGESSAIEAK